MRVHTQTTTAAAPDEARDPAAESPAGRLSGGAEILAQICRHIELAGVTDEDAALLAGEDGAWLEALLEAQPRVLRELRSARARFHLERRQCIGQAEKKGDIDWRPHSYLLENSPAKKAAPADAGERGVRGAAHPQTMITVAELRELQRRRLQAIEALPSPPPTLNDEEDAE